MKTLMLGISMLSLFSLSSFSNGTDKENCKKGAACSADMKKCKDDKKCLQLCKEGKSEDPTKKCEEACKYKPEISQEKAKGCCKK